MKVLVNAVTEVTTASKALVRRMADQPRSRFAELSSSLEQIEYASIEIEHGVRAVLAELVPRAKPC